MSGTEASCAIYESVWEGSKLLSKRGQGEYLRALVAYYFEGKEPDRLSEKAMALWVGNFPRIKRAREVMLSKRTGRAAQPLPECYSSSSASVGKSKNEWLPAGTLPRPPEEVRTVGVGEGVGEGGQTQRCSSQQDFENRLRAVYCEAGRRDLGIDEEKLAKTLKSWTSKWLSNGWVDENGAPMDEPVTDSGSPEGGKIPRWVSMLRAYLEAIESRAEKSYRKRGWS